ncbi:MAG: hypothetical protein C4567_05785 [Deltaproteobacteria bacterium]|nr:MAG: hypothetical protein C4567_05785 [Deltaproteobacteria bacterium]
MKAYRNFSTFIFLSLVLLLLAAPPVGALEYKIVTTVALPSDYAYGSTSRILPRINRAGQVVWLEHRPEDYPPSDPTIGNHMAVYLYSDGSVNKIAGPENGPYRRWEDNWIGPSINSSGVIVWEGMSGVSPNLLYNIFRYSNGSYQSIVAGSSGPDYYWCGYPQISNTGQVVYHVKTPNLDRNIFSYAPSTQITTDSAPVINTRAAVNNSGQIAYQKWDNSGPWFSIYLYANGAHTCIAAGSIVGSETTWNEQPQINDRGQIVWMQSIWSEITSQPTINVCLYSAGQITTLASYYPGLDAWPRINNRGEVVWKNPDGQIVLYSSGKLYTLPYMTGTVPDINDSGTIAWISSEYPDSYLYLMLASPVGGSVAPILKSLLLD